MLVSSALPAASQGRVDRILAQAERQVAAGHPARAIPHLRRAIRAHPDDPRAVLRWAELVLPAEAGPEHAAPVATGAIAEALEAQLARSAEPASQARVASQLEWARALGGDLAGAIDRAVAAVGLQDAASASALRRLAALAVVRGELALAQRALEGARRAMPQDPDVLADLATVLMARGRAAEAVTVYQGVLARRPGDLGALRDLAGARAAAGDLEGAIRALESVVRQAPDRADAWLELARARLEHGDGTGATDAARTAIERRDGSDAEGPIVLGQALTASGDREGARAAFEEALRRRPGSPRATEGLRALEE